MAFKTKPSLRLKWSVRVHACVPWEVSSHGWQCMCELRNAHGNELKSE